MLNYSGPVTANNTITESKLSVSGPKLVAFGSSGTLVGAGICLYSTELFIASQPDRLHGQ